MKKGTKAVRCDMCGVIVGWSIPTGAKEYGIPRVKIKERENCKIIDMGFARHYRCTDCDKKEVKA